MSLESQNIKVPELNWDAIKGKGLSNEEAWKIANDHVAFLIHYQMISRTGLMKKGASEEARTAEKNLEKLREEYEGFYRIIQKTLAEKIKEIAIQDGDSKTLFNRLTVLANEALFHGSVAEWTEESFVRARGTFEEKKNMKKYFWVRIRLSGNESLCLLPYTWRNRTHKSIALILKDLERKATKKWQEEQGIEPRKREVPVETPPEKEKEKIVETPKEVKTVEAPVKPEATPKPEETEAKSKKEKPRSIKSPGEIKSIVSLTTDPEKKKDLVEKKMADWVKKLGLPKKASISLSKTYKTLEDVPKDPTELGKLSDIGKATAKKIIAAVETLKS